MARKGERARWWRRRIGYPLEAALAYAIYGVLARLPVDTASNLGGWIFRTIGPRLGASRKALRNIARAMPETTEEERREIMVGMWDNLGRVLAEYPHLERIWQEDRVEFVGWEHLKGFADTRTAAVVVSGHLANWELMAIGAARVGLPVTLVYRRPNNHLVDGLLRRSRKAAQVPKGREGAKQVFSTLKRGGAVGLLVDQKMNDGIPVPFFGRDAMSAPAAAIFALRLKCPLCVARVERIEGARFRMTIPPPLELPRTGDHNADVYESMRRINLILEGYIRERPEQWLWLHRRWPDS